MVRIKAIRNAVDWVYDSGNGFFYAEEGANVELAFCMGLKEGDKIAPYDMTYITLYVDDEESVFIQEVEPIRGVNVKVLSDLKIPLSLVIADILSEEERHIFEKSRSMVTNVEALLFKYLYRVLQKTKYDVLDMHHLPHLEEEMDVSAFCMSAILMELTPIETEFTVISCTHCAMEITEGIKFVLGVEAESSSNDVIITFYYDTEIEEPALYLECEAVEYERHMSGTSQASLIKQLRSAVKELQLVRA